MLRTLTIDEAKALLEAAGSRSGTTAVPDIPPELRVLVEQYLADAYVASLKEHGYWCPRCQRSMPCPPAWSAPVGWCPFCGMDPRVEGPRRPPREPKGLASLLAT